MWPGSWDGIDFEWRRLPPPHVRFLHRSHKTLKGGVRGVCGWCSTLRPYEAHRLWKAHLHVQPLLHKLRLKHWRCVAYLCSAHTSTHVTCNIQNHWHRSAWTGEGLPSLRSEGGGWGRRVSGANASLSPDRDSSFDTHTVDSKQPWTNGNSGFFSHYVFYFFMVWKENTNCNFKKNKTKKTERKKKKVFRTIIFWVMSLECQLVWTFHRTIKMLF